MVYVLTKENKPLMPTNRHGHVRKLLNSGKAKVVRRCPFTIKLLYDTPNIIQELTLGVDTGSSVIGTAVSTNNGKIVYTSKVTIRNDIKEKMDRRRQFRRTRRNRKTRYRQCRLVKAENKKKNNEDLSWMQYKRLRRYAKVYKGVTRNRNSFSPTMRSKIHSHIKEIEFIKSILPIKTLVIETGTFDPHLMKNPALANPEIAKWGYQKGTNYGFENTKSKVLNRDDYKCHVCKTKKQGVKLEVHHIQFRRFNGSDEEYNLITLCHDCHKHLHHVYGDNWELSAKEYLKLKKNIVGKSKGQLSHATQMNSIRVQLLKYYPEAIETFGYVTKANRLSLGIEKDHHLDACVIASCGKPISNKSSLIKKYCIAKGQYKLTDGKHSENKPDRTPVNGLSANCKVEYFGKEYFINGIDRKGYVILKDIEGNKIDFSYMGKGMKTPKLCNIKRISARKTQLVILNKE